MRKRILALIGVVLEMPGDVLWQTLENGVSQHKEAKDIPDGRFLQVSGIRYIFDSTKEMGERIIAVSLADGTPVLPEQNYCVAVNDYMAGSKGYLDNNGDGYTMLNLFSDTVEKADRVKLVQTYSETYRDALKLYFKTHNNAPIVPKLDGRSINEEQSLGEQNENDT